MKLQYSDLTPKQLDYFLKYIWNGVGSREFVKPPQLIFSEASKLHDFQYFRGGTDSDRKASDKDLLHHMHDAVRAQKLYIRPIYYFLAAIYYIVLSKLGKVAWEYYDKPAQTWDEFLYHLDAYFDREPNKKRPPAFDNS
jgi:hypothetical protein